ncbi:MULTISPECIES: T9SS type A sorting domain-containing protein [unclassified Polaribacter]|uniref:T9SS type A sorting domain-containing protein n=1 Tax=unclassified Polaribacter TaxID=196858 RepID=UPI001679BF32|nr:MULTISPECIES: T9SS type A sorting domain-containing protein [unclassified Polaribacter]
MKKITLFIFLLAMSIGYAQQSLVQDFETGTEGLGEPFGGAAAEIAADPETAGTRGQVAKLISSATGNVWQGLNVNMTSNVVLITDKTMQIDIYSNEAVTIAPRVQGGLDGAPVSTAVVSHTGSGWETLTITFNTGSNGDDTANGVYSQFVIYYLWDNGFIDPAIARVIYADNITGIVEKQLVQDFETGTEGLGEPFGGAAAEIVADPETGGTRGQVAKLISSATGNVWQGLNVNMTSNVRLTTDKTMEIDIYSNEAVTIAPRVQGGLDGAPVSTAVVSHTGSGWETLTITFNTGSNGDDTAEGVYSQFVIYYLWDNGFIDPAIARVIYADNIKGIRVTPPADTSIPTTASATPSSYGTHLALLDGLTDTGTFTNFWNTTYTFGEAPQLLDLDETDGVNIAARINLKIGWGGGAKDGNNADVLTDVSEYDTVHIDYFIPSSVEAGSNGHQFYLDLISQTNGGNTEAFYGFGTTVGGADSGVIDEVVVFDAWQSIDIPLATFVGKGFDATNFLQFKIGAQSDIRTQLGYFDNLYFYKASTLSANSNELLGFSMYPNPTSNILNISAKETIQNAQIFNVLGKEVMSLNINKNSESIDVSSLSSGIYLIKYQSNGAVGTAKFVKE